MYKVLIADDNALIRKSILKRVPWFQMDMECIGEAENGKETVEIITRLHPDIVITDIKMPVADGFYAIEAAKELFPDIQFIIISGYDDFAYLKQSIQFQVLNYIMKPIDTEELIESLQNAAAQCSRQKSDKAYKSLYDRKHINDIFKRFLTEEIDFHTFAEKLTQLPYPLLNEYYQCICLNCPTDGECKDLLEDSMCEQLEKKLEDICYPSSCRILRMYHNTYLAIIANAHPTPLSSRLLQKIYECTSQLTGIPGPLYIASAEPVNLHKLTTAYHNALLQLLHRFTVSNEQTFIFNVQSQLAVSEPPAVFPNQELALVFELQMYDECKRIIERILQKASTSFDMFCISIPQLMDFLDMRLSPSLGRHLFGRQMRELYLLLFEDLKQLQAALCQMIDQLPRPENANVSNQVVLYIKGNYRNPLTLQKLSELFYVNQIYLGQLIKKQTGQSFNTLLNELRMKDAKQIILKHPDITLNALALSLGYTDAFYFTKVFKRYYGFTPSEFKKKQ